MNDVATKYFPLS